LSEIIINKSGETRQIRGAIDPVFADKKIVPDSHQVYLTQMVAEQRMRREFDTSQNEATVEIQTGQPWIAVFVTGDWHIGSERTDYVLWDKHQHIVLETPGVFECIVGDERDNFVIPKHATGRDEHLINPHQQAEFIAWHLRRLEAEGKLLARTGGNHDGWTWMMSGIHLEQIWYRELKSPLLENGGFVHINVNDTLYDFYLHHGLSLFNSNFNPNHATRRAFEFQGPFDVGAMGHTHVSEIAHGYKWNDEYQKEIVMMRTGTYKLDDQFARSKQLGRGQLPGATVLLNSQEKKMMPFAKLEDAVTVMEALNLYGISQGMLGSV
jgi:hypothetical protein